MVAPVVHHNNSQVGVLDKGALQFLGVLHLLLRLQDVGDVHETGDELGVTRILDEQTNLGTDMPRAVFRCEAQGNDDVVMALAASSRALKNLIWSPASR